MKQSFAAYLSRHAATAYGIAVLLLLTLEEYLLWCTAGRMFSPYVMVYALADMALLSVPYWWLRGRWRMLALVPSWLFSIYFLCNSLYFRFWGSLMPLGQFGQAGNMNGVLIDSALGVFTAPDIIYILSPLLVTIPWLWPRTARAICRQAIAKRSGIVVSCASIAFFLITAHALCYRNMRNYGAKSPISISRLSRQCIHTYTHPDIFAMSSGLGLIHHGLLPHLYYEFNNLLSEQSTISLTESQRKEIDRYLASKTNRSTPVDSVKARNLIFIIVESLNADAMYLNINGRRITPTLDSLASAEGSVSCLKVISQAGIGHSANGQLIYNLGTLPTSIGIASCDFVPKMKSTPALPRVLSDAYHSEAIFGTDGISWRERDAHLCFGYSLTFVSNDYVDFASANSSADGAMFAFGLQQLKCLKQPFLLTLITAQMHVPYKTDGMEKVDFAGMGLTEKRQRYLTCTADFDRQLGRFLQGLREAGMADNTMVVIASDHNAPGTTKPDGSPADIVFIAANARRTPPIDEPVHQVDVFPTILDLMGVQSAWRGVGHSMLGPQRGESDPRQATVSDSILRSDYFPLQ